VSHLRFSGVSDAQQRHALVGIVRDCPVLMAALETAKAMDLPDWWIVSGAIYNQVWNALTGRPDMYGVKDIDVFYFDPDTSYEAEDAVIRRGATLFSDEPPVEIRNQARVHLWSRDHFGRDCPQYHSSRDGIDHFASKTHCVGIRLGHDLEIYAPFGLRDIFSFRLTPNPVLDNRETHERKAARQSALWPELEIIPWPTEPAPAARQADRPHRARK